VYATYSPIYPLLALLGVHAISLAFTHRKWRVARSARDAACWFGSSGFVLAPTLITSPGQSARRHHPDAFLAESDLDWGQICTG